MIVVENLVKRYRSHHGTEVVLDNINLQIPSDAKVAVIGKNGAGKTTLLNLLGGMDWPTKGSVKRLCRVSWPLGLAGGFQGSLSGIQNARFIARIHGVTERDLPERLEFIREFADIGSGIDKPVKSLSSGMRSRLAFGISMAFDFDLYLVDELTSVGDAAFRKKSREAFRSLAARSGLVMVSHDEATLKNFCNSAIWIHDRQAQWFDDLGEALASYKAATR